MKRLEQADYGEMMRSMPLTDYHELFVQSPLRSFAKSHACASQITDPLLLASYGLQGVAPEERYQKLIEQSNLCHAAFDFFTRERQIANPTYGDLLQYQAEIEKKYYNWLWDANHPWHE